MAMTPCAEVATLPQRPFPRSTRKTYPKWTKSFAGWPYAHAARGFFYFDLAFHGLGPARPAGYWYCHDLGLSHAEKGMMVATPVLAGALLRIIMGIWLIACRRKGRDHRAGRGHRYHALRLAGRCPFLR